MFKYFFQVCFICVLVLAARDVNAFDSAGVAKAGVADLRQTDLHARSLELQGEWSFAWKKLFSPSDQKNYPAYITFPELWNGKTINGERLSAQGFATYQLIVLLPGKREQLALNIPDIYSSYRLYLNGKIISSSGNPAASRESYTPNWTNNTVAITDLSDTLVLTLQVANFSHAKGGSSKAITIGDSALLLSDREKTLAGDFLLTGCLFMGGLFFFGLYLFGRRDKATLYFSLFCMAYSYRIVGSAMYSLLSVFPDLNWEVTVRLEYFTLFASIFLLIQYVRHLYPKDVHNVIIKLLLGFCTLVAATPILLPTSVFTSIIEPFLLVMFFCIAYVIFVFIKAYRNRRPAAEYGLVSIAVLMLVMLIINLEYFGVIVPSHLIVFAGYIAFFFLQSMILSFRFAFTLQKAREQAEEGLKAKSEFLSTMSHEIRTPLNSVIGMTHLMLKNDPRKDQKEQLDVLLFSAANLLSIVNNILDYSKIEAGRISFEHIEMDVPHILRNIVSGYGNAASEKGIDLQLDFPDDFNVKVLGDPTRLTQVISNLIGNAIKFTHEGKVGIEMLVSSQSKDKVALTFKISDTGIGIPKDKQKLIFEQFTQADSSTSRSFGGTGLGLAISKKILEMQGVMLELESEVGSGATFYFNQTFPISKQEASQALEKADAIPPIEKDGGLRGTTILLVEDNPMNVFVARSFLQKWGAEIEVAENGLEAIKKLDVKRHNLVLMDMHMPVMDGFEATRRIRQQGINVPIIALTASLPNEIKSELDELGIDGLVLKPFVPADLFKAVSRFVLLEQE
jgi:two-component system, sensor histidine kinase